MLEANALADKGRAENNPDKFDQAAGVLRRALGKHKGDDQQLYVALGMVLLAQGTFLSAAAKEFKVPAEARKRFEQALKLNPRSTEALSGLAKYYEFNREYEEALAVTERALKISPDNGDLLMHKGRCLLEAGHYARAEKSLLATQELLRTRGDLRNQVFIKELLGKAYLKQGKFKEAESMLVSAVEQAEAGNVAACPYAALGELYEATGRRDKMVKTAMRAADMESGAPEMQYFAASDCYDEGHYKDALKYIDRALALQPGHQRFKDLQQKIKVQLKPGSHAAEFKYALAAFNEHSFRAARRHIDRSLADKKTPRAWVVKGFLLLLEREYEAAEKLFHKAAKAAPEDLGVVVGLGHLGIVRKRYAEARRLLEKEPLAVRKQTSGSGYSWLTRRMAWLGMGWLLSNQGKYAEAMRFFDHILSIEDEDWFALLGLANSLNAMGTHYAAQNFLERLLTLDPDNQYAMAELALVHLNKGKLDRAEVLFKAALARDTTSRYTCPYEGLGMVYLRAGKLKQAKDHFSKAIKINPNIEFKKFNGLARIMIREGKLDRARELLRKSMENYPYDGEAKRLAESIREQK